MPLKLTALLLLAAALPAAAQFRPIVPDELAMTSQPEVPGAPAVYLYREETTDDHLHVFSIYARIKILTERGNEYANVELPYARNSDGGGFSIDNIQGRTIHADGTIIPMTAKALSKLVDKTGDLKFMSKTFTLPDVQVGSVIEYSYQKRLDDHYFSSPDWYIQSDLFTRKAHYGWRPTNETIVINDERGTLSTTVAWTPILPPGTAVKLVTLPASGMNRDGQNVITLDIANVPPAPHEELMPPIRSFTYRVLFYYSAFRTADEFWKSEGKHWSKVHDKFIGPGPGVTAAVARLTSPADAPEAKLRKLYAAVMELDNTDLTRSHSKTEDKSEGLKNLRSTDDVLDRKRGSGDQLAGLFVAMARAAGLKASLMVVTNRDRSLFFPAYLSTSQLDDDIAIVSIDGKDRFFDPGTRFCPFGDLAWKHTYAGGLRQNEHGTELATSPAPRYTASRIQRVANLTMDEHGEVTGTVKLTFTGAPALPWRQQSVTGDATSLKRELTSTIEHLLPGGMTVNIASIDDPALYEKPFTVTANVKGAIGSPTDKRLLIPADLFESNAHPLFPHEKRELPVYFEYAHTVQDAIRINLPPTLTVEAAPAQQKQQMKTLAAFDLTSEKTPTSVTIRRNYILGSIGFAPAEYPELRDFFTKMETKNQEPIILTHTIPTATLQTPGTTPTSPEEQQVVRTAASNTF